MFLATSSFDLYKYVHTIRRKLFTGASCGRRQARIGMRECAALVVEAFG